VIFFHALGPPLADGFSKSSWLAHLVEAGFFCSVSPPFLWAIDSFLSFPASHIEGGPPLRLVSRLFFPSCTQEIFSCVTPPFLLGNLRGLFGRVSFPACSSRVLRLVRFLFFDRLFSNFVSSFRRAMAWPGFSGYRWSLPPSFGQDERVLWDLYRGSPPFLAPLKGVLSGTGIAGPLGVSWISLTPSQTLWIPLPPFWFYVQEPLRLVWLRRAWCFSPRETFFFWLLLMGSCRVGRYFPSS